MTIDNLYERDFTAWAEAQTEALRKRSANEIDWENVAEEIESVGRSDTRAFNSLVEHILAHMLKIEFSGATEPLAHWRYEIGVARLNLEDTATPTLRARAPEDLSKRYRRARKTVLLNAEKRAEPPPDLPLECPYVWADVLGRGADWIPPPRG